MTNQPKHTPGPWNVERHGESVHDHDMEIWNQNTRIAFVNLSHEPSMNVCDEANARLIAAAPELLEALQLILTHSTRYTANTFDESTKAALVLACFAVTKATGGAE